MSDTQGHTWANNPYAPKVPYEIYLREKATFAGNLVGSMLYGTRKTATNVYIPALTLFIRFIPGAIITLFFNCMAALFNPVHRRGEGVKWGLVSYTVVIFLFATVSIGMNLDVQSICFIDNREFPGFEGGWPGPHGYQYFIGPEAVSIIPLVTFPLTNWLADGLLVRSFVSAAFTCQGV